MRVTQSAPSLLGGVSKQPDTKKGPGQVRDILNGNPSPIYGLMKRPGFKYLSKITAAPTTAKWFHINRDGGEIYVFYINPSTGAIGGYNLLTGAAVSITITDPTNVAAYLTCVNKDSLDVATIQDTTFIVDKSTTVTALSADSGRSAKFGKQGTVRILSAMYDSTYTFKVTNLDNPASTWTVTYTTGAPPTNPLTPDPGLMASTIANSLRTSLAAAIPSATVRSVNSNIFFECTHRIKVEVSNGIEGSLMRAYTDGVSSFSHLAADEANGRIVRVYNELTNADDDYFVEFVTGDASVTGSTVSGTGFWKEVQDPRLSTGITPTTMPVVLVNTAVDTFTLGFANWSARLVGDDNSNPQPSFVGAKINHVFFYENRLGFLSGSNIIMSEADDYLNFYNRSAKVQTDADPIDLSVSSIRPANLHASVSITQGLLLFSDAEQFLVYATDTRLAPSTLKIRSIGRYQNTPLIHPVSTGENVMIPSRAFENRNRGATQIFSMIPRGLEQPPVTNIVTTVVEDWIPPTVDQMVLTYDNNYLFLCDVSSRDIYCLRSYEQNGEKLFNAWVRWRMPGTVHHLFTTNREIFLVLQNTVGASTVTTFLHGEFGFTSDSSVIRYPGTNQYINPSFDFWSTPQSITKKTYPDGRISTVFVPQFTDVDTSLTPIAVWTEGDDTPEFSGNYTVLERTADGLEAPLDISTLSLSDVAIGYQFDFEIELPVIYFQSERGTDPQATLIIDRNKFVAGFTDSLEFDIQADGRPDWEPLYSNIISDAYLADTTPIGEGYIYDVPIHQRNTNYSLRVRSSTPFPISLVSMSWEGNYIPRFYRRA